MFIEEPHDFSFFCSVLVYLLVYLLQIEILKYELIEIESGSETREAIATQGRTFIFWTQFNVIEVGLSSE